MRRKRCRTAEASDVHTTPGAYVLRGILFAALVVCFRTTGVTAGPRLGPVAGVWIRCRSGCARVNSPYGTTRRAGPA